MTSADERTAASAGSTTLRGVEFGMRCVVIVAALGFLGLLAWCIALRVRYSYELEWMEGAMLRIATRAGAGEPLYVEPTIDFTMSVYAPLYFWLAGLSQQLLGEGFFGPRMVSVLAIGATLLLIVRFVRRSSDGMRPALANGAAWVGAGFYAATYGVGDAYHDTVHVDSLFVLWLLSAFYGLRFWTGTRGAVACGLLLALAFATKQSALLAIAVMPVAAWWGRGFRHAAVLAFAAIVPAGAWLLTLGVSSEGWSHYFLLGQLAGHEFEGNMWRGFWTFDLGRHVPFAFASATVAVLAVLAKRDWVASAALGSLATALVGIGYASRLHKGGAENVLYPTYAAIAVLGALGLARAWSVGDRRPLLALGASLACVAQFALLAYDPGRFVPTEQDARAGDRFVAAIRALEGEVLVSFHGQIAAFAGEPPVAHPITIADVLRTEGAVATDGAAVGDAYRDHLREVLQSHRFDAIVMEDTVTDAWWRATVEEFYREDGPLLDDPQYRWIAAKSVWPAMVWVPR